MNSSTEIISKIQNIWSIYQQSDQSNEDFVVFIRSFLKLTDFLFISSSATQTSGVFSSSTCVSDNNNNLTCILPSQSTHASTINSTSVLSTKNSALNSDYFNIFNSFEESLITTIVDHLYIYTLQCSEALYRLSKSPHTRNQLKFECNMEKIMQTFTSGLNEITNQKLNSNKTPHNSKDTSGTISPAPGLENSTSGIRCPSTGITSPINKTNGGITHNLASVKISNNITGAPSAFASGRNSKAETTNSNSTSSTLNNFCSKSLSPKELDASLYFLSNTLCNLYDPKSNRDQILISKHEKNSSSDLAQRCDYRIKIDLFEKYLMASSKHRLELLKTIAQANNSTNSSNNLANHSNASLQTHHLTNEAINDSIYNYENETLLLLNLLHSCLVGSTTNAVYLCEISSSNSPLFSHKHKTNKNLQNIQRNNSISSISSINSNFRDSINKDRDDTENSNNATSPGRKHTNSQSKPTNHHNFYPLSTIAASNKIHNFFHPSLHHNLNSNNDKSSVTRFNTHFLNNLLGIAIDNSKCYSMYYKNFKEIEKSQQEGMSITSTVSSSGISINQSQKTSLEGLGKISALYTTNQINLLQKIKTCSEIMTTMYKIFFYLTQKFKDESILYNYFYYLFDSSVNSNNHSVPNSSSILSSTTGYLSSSSEYFTDPQYLDRHSLQESTFSGLPGQINEQNLSMNQNPLLLSSIPNINFNFTVKILNSLLPSLKNSEFINTLFSHSFLSHYLFKISHQIDSYILLILIKNIVHSSHNMEQHFIDNFGYSHLKKILRVTS